MSPTPDYLRDPEKRSTGARSRSCARRPTSPASRPTLHDVAVRIVHACGMPDVVADLDWGGEPAAAGRAALAGRRTRCSPTRGWSRTG